MSKAVTFDPTVESTIEYKIGLHHAQQGQDAVPELTEPHWWRRRNYIAGYAAGHVEATPEPSAEKSPIDWDVIYKVRDRATALGMQNRLGVLEVTTAEVLELSKLTVYPSVPGAPQRIFGMPFVVTDKRALIIEQCLRDLVELKDGVRGPEYESRKPLAWEAARSALGIERAK